MAERIGLVTIEDPMAPASESYRSLRMNLQFAALDHKLRTLLITSPGPGEGKTTTLANLAVTMAQMEQRVIIADCDLRRPFPTPALWPEQRYRRHHHDGGGCGTGAASPTRDLDQGPALAGQRCLAATPI
jgi:hypothetical protein